MTEPLASYLPQDRRQALARGEELPGRTHGTARRCLPISPASRR